MQNVDRRAFWFLAPPPPLWPYSNGSSFTVAPTFALSPCFHTRATALLFGVFWSWYFEKCSVDVRPQEFLLLLCTRTHTRTR